jgi:hypothetical protein
MPSVAPTNSDDNRRSAKQFRCRGCGSGDTRTTKRHPLQWNKDGKPYLLREKQCRDCGHKFKTFEIREQDLAENDSLYELLKVAITGAGAQDASHVYLVGHPGGYTKIGIARDANNRLRNLQTSSPVPLRLLAFFRLPNPKGVEKTLHDYFRDKRVSGEWFNLSGHDIKQICSAFWQLDPEPQPNRPVTLAEFVNSFDD